MFCQRILWYFLSSQLSRVNCELSTLITLMIPSSRLQSIRVAHVTIKLNNHRRHTQPAVTAVVQYSTEHV